MATDQHDKGESQNGTLPYWERKSLAQMSDSEWEQLCDRCGRCCLIKLEDDDTAKVYTTRLSCRLLDISTCTCSDYINRHQMVLDCIAIGPQSVGEISWLPRSCAYRVVHEGRKLEWWHPLISGNPETVHEAGISVRSIAIGEDSVPHSSFESYIIKSV